MHGQQQNIKKGYISVVRYAEINGRDIMKQLKEAFVVHLKIPLYHISGNKYQSGQVNQNSSSTQEFGK